jgi:CTD kinase subunit beta
MEPVRSRAQSPSQTPTSSSKYHHPYFTPAEVEYLSEKQRGKLSATQENKVRQNACGFLEALGARTGLYVSLLPSVTFKIIFDYY